MTVQVSATGPVNPAFVVTVMFEAVVPPGEMACGSKAAAVSVKSAWADAGTTKRPANRQRSRTPVCPVGNFNLEADPSNFSMSRFGFKYLRFLGPQKSCPRTPATLTSMTKIVPIAINAGRCAPF